MFLGHVSLTNRESKREYVYPSSISWKWHCEASWPAFVYGYIEQMARQHGHISHTRCLTGTSTDACAYRQNSRTVGKRFKYKVNHVYYSEETLNLPQKALVCILFAGSSSGNIISNNDTSQIKLANCGELLCIHNFSCELLGLCRVCNCALA